MSVPVFSLCHTTKRLPDGWRDARAAWLAAADRPQEVEYILCVDHNLAGNPTDQLLELLPPVGEASLKHCLKVIVNNGRACAVDGWNCAAAASTGQILITVADDWFPPEHWDTLLLASLPKNAAGGPDLAGEYVIEVATGGHAGLLTFSILTRKRYERFGYIFYPEYVGMMADDDFTFVARHDGVVIDARHLMFPHYHPEYGTAANDSTYEYQHRPEAWDCARKVWRQRLANRFDGRGVPAIQPAGLADDHRPVLGVCMPGPSFSTAWVIQWTILFAHLLQRYRMVSSFITCSNQYTARDLCAKHLLEAVKAKGYKLDYVLWIDSDNLLSPEGFDLLRDAIEKVEVVDAIGGWYWIDVDPPEVCAAQMERDGSVRQVKFEEIQEAATERELLRVTGHMGFGALLMKPAVLETAGAYPFSPIVLESGEFMGDDVSFCRRAFGRGYAFFLHPGCYLPHLKLKEVVGRVVQIPTKETSGFVSKLKDSFEKVFS